MEAYIEIIGDYSAYTDRWGLIQSGPIQSDGTVGTSQNGLRYTSEYAYALYLRRIDADANRILHVVRTCEVSPGLYKRSPDGELSVLDDYVGLAVISWLYDATIADRILEYGVRHFGFWGNRWNNFLWRYPALIGALKVAAGGSPNFWNYAWFLGSLLFSDTQQDSLALTAQLSWIYEGRSRVIDWAIARRRKQFKEHYPHGYGQMFGEYSRVPNHPTVKYLDMVF